MHFDIIRYTPSLTTVGINPAVVLLYVVLTTAGILTYHILNTLGISPYGRIYMYIIPRALISMYVGVRKRLV